MPVYQREQRLRELRELRARIDHEIAQLEVEINAGHPGPLVFHVTRRPYVRPTVTPEITAATIRAWAREHGIDVPPRGRVSIDIREQYAEAQRSA